MVSSGSDVGFLQLSTAQSVSCQLHPVVMFQVLDHHTRRNAEEGRVVGALLGSVGSDGTVSLKNAFPMNHDDVIHNPQAQEFNHFFNTMADLHQRVNSREQVVGWYTTAKSSDAGKDEVGEDDVALHAFFEEKIGEKMPCILLRVDGNIQKNPKMGISAFVASNMALRQDKESAQQVLGKCFTRVTCNIRSYEAERIGVDFITQNSIGEGGGEVLGSDLEKLEMSVVKLTAMLDKTIEYCDEVEKGKIKADTQVGRELMEAVTSVPDVSPAEFEASLNKGLHDLLMVHYLGSLTQSQICFWQRMQTMP
eukprot:CAMPEP_0179448464 /NCGR_PEP_ID=MMETSP0799-20121207/32293_1 /TAXON_ID=46947 /ORGANISM="Geminigera cryophila, Strain CCMP2564" /LENGTH=307 /DNA_ID=CAMNT_0021240299 /DNA_START=37 /DNA_END=960 /DNA_ORIENTATION=+